MLALNPVAPENALPVLPPVAAGLLFASVLATVGGYPLGQTALAAVGGAVVGVLADMWLNPDGE